MQLAAAKIFKSVPTLREITIKFVQAGLLTSALWFVVGRFTLVDLYPPTFAGYEVGINEKGVREVKTYRDRVPNS
jgi:hypothetical protein